MAGEEQKIEQNSDELIAAINVEYNSNSDQYRHLSNYKDKDNFGQIVQSMSMSVDLALPVLGMSSQAELPQTGQEDSVEAFKFNAVVGLFKGMNPQREGMEDFNETIEAFGGKKMDTDTYDLIREQVEQVPDSETIGSNSYLEAKRLHQKSSGSEVSTPASAYVPTLENDSQVIMEVASAAIEGMSVELFTESTHSRVSELSDAYEPVTPDSLGEEFSKEFSKKMAKHVSNQWDHLNDEKAQELVSSLVEHPHFDLEDPIKEKLKTVQKNGESKTKETQEEARESIPLIDTPDEELQKWNQQVREESASKVIASALRVNRDQNKLASLKDDAITEAFAKEARAEDEKERAEQGLIPTPEVDPEMETFINKESQNVEKLNNAATSIQSVARVLKAKNAFKSKLEEKVEENLRELHSVEERRTQERIEEAEKNGTFFIPEPEGGKEQEISDFIEQSEAAKVIQSAARDKLVGQRKRSLEDDASLGEVNSLIADETIEPPAKDLKLEEGNKARQELRKQMANRNLDIDDESFSVDTSSVGMDMQDYNKKVSGKDYATTKTEEDIIVEPEEQVSKGSIEAERSANPKQKGIDISQSNDGDVIEVSNDNAEKPKSVEDVIGSIFESLFESDVLDDLEKLSANDFKDADFREGPRVTETEYDTSGKNYEELSALRNMRRTSEGVVDGLDYIEEKQSQRDRLQLSTGQFVDGVAPIIDSINSRGSIFEGTANEVLNNPESDGFQRLEEYARRDLGDEGVLSRSIQVIKDSNVAVQEVNGQINSVIDKVSEVITPILEQDPSTNLAEDGNGQSVQDRVKGILSDSQSPEFGALKEYTEQLGVQARERQQEILPDISTKPTVEITEVDPKTPASGEVAVGEQKWESFAGSEVFNESGKSAANVAAQDGEKIPLSEAVFPKQQNVDFGTDADSFESEKKEVKFAPGTRFNKEVVEPEVVVEEELRQKTAPVSEIKNTKSERSISDTTLNGIEEPKEEVSNEAKETGIEQSKKSRLGKVFDRAKRGTDLKVAGAPAYVPVAIATQLSISGLKGVANAAYDVTGGRVGRQRRNVDRDSVPYGTSPEVVIAEKSKEEGRVDLADVLDSKAKPESSLIKDTRLKRSASDTTLDGREESKEEEKTNPADLFEVREPTYAPVEPVQEQKGAEIELTYSQREIADLYKDKDRLENGSKQSRAGKVASSILKETDDFARDRVGVPLVAAAVAVPKGLFRSAAKGVRNIIGEGNKFMGIKGRKRLNVDRDLLPDRQKNDADTQAELEQRLKAVNDHIGNSEQAKSDFSEVFADESKKVEKVGISKPLRGDVGDYSQSWVKYTAKDADGKDQTHLERYNSSDKSTRLEI